MEWARGISSLNATVCHLACYLSTMALIASPNKPEGKNLCIPEKSFIPLLDPCEVKPQLPLHYNHRSHWTTNGMVAQNLVAQRVRSVAQGSSLTSIYGFSDILHCVATSSLSANQIVVCRHVLQTLAHWRSHIVNDLLQHLSSSIVYIYIIFIKWISEPKTRTKNNVNNRTYTKKTENIY